MRTNYKLELFVKYLSRIDSISIANSQISHLKMAESRIEQKLRKIIDGNKPKSIKVDGKTYYISRSMIDNIKLKEKTGGILPLIPLIIGAITAAGTVAGGAAGIAKAVDDKKAHDNRQREQERHNRELEQIARGNGNLKSSIKSFTKMQNQLDDKGKRALKNTLYNLADHVKVEQLGDGLYLNPYRS